MDIYFHPGCCHCLKTVYFDADFYVGCNVPQRVDSLRDSLFDCVGVCDKPTMFLKVTEVLCECIVANRWKHAI